MHTPDILACLYSSQEIKRETDIVIKSHIQQQQQQQLFYGPLSATTWVSRYQKKHSPTHHPDHHPIFISSFHLLRSPHFYWQTKWGDGGGGHWLVRMEWRPARWSVCLPLLIFACTIKSRSSLLAPAYPSAEWSRKKGRKTDVCVCVCVFHLPRSIPSSLFKLHAWQSFCTTSLHVLFGLPLGLEPSTSYSIHFFTQSVSSFHNTCSYHQKSRSEDLNFRRGNDASKFLNMLTVRKSVNNTCTTIHIKN